MIQPAIETIEKSDERRLVDHWAHCRVHWELRGRWQGPAAAGGSNGEQQDYPGHLSFHHDTISRWKQSKEGRLFRHTVQGTGYALVGKAQWQEESGGVDLPAFTILELGRWMLVFS